MKTRKPLYIEADDNDEDDAGEYRDPLKCGRNCRAMYTVNGKKNRSGNASQFQ